MWSSTVSAGRADSSRPTVSRPMPRTFGVRPAATRISSATSSVPSASVNVTLPPSRAHGRPPTPRRTSMPSRTEHLEQQRARLGLLRGDQPIERLDDGDLHPEAGERLGELERRSRHRRARSSRPAGCVSLKTSRLVHGAMSASPGTGGMAGAVPVLSTTARAGDVHVVADANRPGPSSTPCPRTKRAALAFEALDCGLRRSSRRSPRRRCGGRRRRSRVAPSNGRPCRSHVGPR